jgi:antitoxin component YwqK of YwqJK toxin-antitoxin module
MDLDFDGVPDVVVYYKDGNITHKELSLGFDGIFTIFKHYNTNGDLLRIEHDEDGNGVIDRWDYYENRRLVRTGWDEDGDGVPDRFDTL